jgi:hypothetical protein
VQRHTASVAGAIPKIFAALFSLINIADPCLSFRKNAVHFQGYVGAPKSPAFGTNIFNYFSETEVEGGKKGRRNVGRNVPIFDDF